MSTLVCVRKRPRREDAIRFRAMSVEFRLMSMLTTMVNCQTVIQPITTTVPYSSVVCE